MPVSYSQLFTYRRCPKQYEYAYVENVPRAMSPGESFGSSIHNTLRKFGLLEMELARENDPKKQLTLFVDDHSHDMKLDLSLTTLLGFWRESFIAQGYASRKDMEEKLEAGARALEHFFVWWREKQRTVVAIEKGFSLQLPDGPVLSGRFDRVERGNNGLRIIDFKSSGPRGAEYLREDLQLSIYARAAVELWQEPVEELMLLSVSENGVVEEKTTRTEEELQSAEEEILTLCHGMEKADFTPNPSVTRCGSCPYRAICPSSAVASGG